MFVLALGLALIVHGQTTAPTSVSTTITFATTTTLSIPSGCTDKVTQTATAVTIVQTCIASFTPPPTPISGNATIAVPGATVGKAYSVNIAPLIAAKNGVPPYSYAAGSGFPAWLTVSKAGILAGTPTAAGTFNLTIITSDSSGGTSAKNVVVTSAAISGR